MTSSDVAEDFEKNSPFLPQNQNLQIICSRKSFLRTKKRKNNLRWRLGAILVAFVGSIVLSAYSVNLSLGHNVAPEHKLRYARSTSENGNGTSEEAGAESNSSETECVEPAMNEFPKDGFTPEQRKGGAVIIHILLSMYMFLGLAIICDDYFVASLEQIVEKLQLSDDVAGATFMAAGSSAPELFTSLIGVFIAKSDVGTGTIVGSAVFNILVIIGLCGLFCTAAIQLSWWPLARDSSCYLVSIGVLIAVLYDGNVYWYEAAAMVSLYFCYIIIMKFNQSLQNFVVSLRGKKPKESTADDVNGDAAVPLTAKESKVELKPNGSTVAQIDVAAGQNLQESNGMANVGLRLMISNNFAPKTRLRMASRLLIMERKNILAAREGTGVNGETERYLYRDENSKLSEPEEEDEESFIHPFKPPKDSFTEFMKWFISWPLLFLFFFTIPNCNKYQKWFLLTFLMSIVWITIFSYIMVWMICITGFTFGIPDTVMGITFLAAGTSVPDTIASVLVARNGYGDMAVSNSIGSNVFDIFLGLGLPWLLKTTIRPNGGDEKVHINSKGLLASVGLLMCSLIVVVLGIHLNRWQLTKKLGVVIMFTYGVFLVLSILIETNTFMQINPPTCV
ncbi:Oidioi.mRNA.OKI2018_I69.PAR.g10471.t2.cds [Oikopleura dioica]|uniref:Oidioi.mRNA.OKI2018_I69.PAR.g10471.t2.cds n=1 Tax=Oikopleura dioica TaxID=34765 RepID=A0ABN7RW07_OIKDI|nr:Oidioi.mRNA.OKI2018_I69.PAR.g10471.t2.cds [Oikopleura dioica]